MIDGGLEVTSIMSSEVRTASAKKSFSPFSVDSLLSHRLGIRLDERFVDIFPRVWRFSCNTALEDQGELSRKM